MEGLLPQLTVGLIIDSLYTTKYTYEIAEWGQKQGNIVISHLIIQGGSQISQGRISKAINSARTKGPLFLFAQIFFFLLTRIENTLLKRHSHHRDHFQPFNLGAIVPRSLHVVPRVSPSGHVYLYSDEDVSRIKALNLDVLIRYGSGILRGPVLNAARFGILSFHHADNAINRGGPPGFWEVLFRQDATGFVIQQLTEELDGGNILVSGRFPTKFHYLLNQAALYKKSNFYMKSLLNELARTRTLPPPKESQPYFNPLFKRPGLSDQAAYACKLLSCLAQKLITRQLLGKKYRWGVAFARGDWKTLVMWRSSRIKNPKNHSLATPFAIRENDRDFCFVENYDYSTERACISVYELTGRKAEMVGNALTEPFHTSFPYLFRFDGKIYMCPETSEINEIRLYECVEFPLNWKLSKVLMPNVKAVGSMIFYKEGLWWLFTNIDPSDTDENCSELYIFSSDTPVSENWRPHPKNPLFSDSTRARNGGILIQNDSIYRIGQKQGFDRYGNGFSINKVSALSQQAYVENEVCSVAPNFFSNIKGTHHLHDNGKVVVFDYVELAHVKK